MFIRGVGAIRRIDLGDGNWVDVKKRLTVADREHINNAAMGGGVRAAVRTNPTTGDEEAYVAMGDASFAAVGRASMEVAVQAWGGPGFCINAEAHDEGSHHQSEDEVGSNANVVAGPGSDMCRPRPVTSTAIRELDEGIGERIVAEINGTNPTPRKEETAHP